MAGNDDALQELLALTKTIENDSDEDIFTTVPPDMQHSRYIQFNENDTAEFIENQKKINTVHSTNTATNQFRQWLTAMRPTEQRALNRIPHSDLDNYLAEYFLGTRQKNGEEYEPDTLTSYQRGIDRYLQDNGYPFSIIRDKEFAKSRKCLAAKRVELKKQGRGNKPNAAEIITDEEERILHEKGIIGRQSPESLFRSVWLNNTKLLGFRGGQENRELKWGDIILKKTASGLEYLEFNERNTKTRFGQLGQTPRPFNPKIFATPETPTTCPVLTWKEYEFHRPQDMRRADTPFYLSINYSPSTNTWYKRTPMGKNTLATVVQTMMDKAGIEGKKTNHSVRKTAITKLLHAGVPPTQLQQLSGHKQTQSINSYAVASLEQQREMSNILSHPQHTQTHHSTHLQTQQHVPHTQTLTATQVHSSTENRQTNSETATTLFSGATIYGGSFTIHVAPMPSPPSKRRRPFVMYDSSDSDY